MDAISVPKLSIIIPLYNKASYIKRALDSVLTQTVQDFEIIVVGGNSTDGSEDIVLSYSDPRIRFVKELGKGVSAARNQGVYVAQSDFVAFLDADDEWLPEFIETILTLKNTFPGAGIYGTGYKRILPSGDERICQLDFTNDGGELLYFREKLRYPVMIILTSGMVIPKSVFLEVGGFPVGYSQNEDRCLRAKIALNYPVIYCPKICAVYYVDSINTAQRLSGDFCRDPFSDYVIENKALLTLRNDWDEICDFCNLATISLMALNLLYSEFNVDVRKVLRDIETRRYVFEKYAYLFASYLPKCLRYLVVKLVLLYRAVFIHIQSKITTQYN